MKRLLVALAVSACGGKKISSTTQLKIAVTDATTHAPIGARVLLWNGDQPLHIGSIDLYGQRQGATACEFAPGVIGTWDGIVLATGAGEVPVGVDRCAPTPAIPYGHYKVWAWHGIDHEIWKGEVDLSANRDTVALEIPLERAWTAGPTVVAADMHVHAHASNDSGMPDTQRVAAQVTGGIDVIGLSNHNSNGDASAAIHALGLDGKVFSIPSNEITSEMMHAGIYPARGAAPPADKVITADPKTLMAMLRALPDHPIIQINHPRFRYQSLFDTTHWDGVSWPPPFPLDFDAVEVVPGYAAFNVAGDRRLDDGLRDLYTLYSHGHPVAAMGGSDTHDFNWVLDGTGRTFVQLGSPNYTEAGFLSAVRARRTMATSGPWLDAAAWVAKGDPHVGPGQVIAARDGKVYVTITTAQASWMNATRLRITIGDKTTTVAIDKKALFSYELELEVGTEDTFIGVAIDGDDPEPLELTGTYQRDKWKHPGVTPFAVISPILVDADGDHHWKRGDADIAY
ncbi:MAG TPA: CehA/McbA family metallohydrolase [Kofleriaceae bacterium]